MGFERKKSLDRSQCEGKEAYMVYFQKTATSSNPSSSTPSVSVFDCSVVPHAAVLLFAGKMHIVRSEKSGKSTGKVRICDWIEMSVSEEDAVLCKKLREEIERLLRVIVERPGEDISTRLNRLRAVIDLVVM
jgi:hypothetical protein